MAKISRPEWSKKGREETKKYFSDKKSYGMAKREALLRRIKNSKSYNTDKNK